MKKIILSIAILTLNFSDAFSHVDHYSKYNKLEYELFRNNKLIGFHNYLFKRSEGNLSVLSEVKFKVTKLGVDLYTYFAKSEENYKKNVFRCIHTI